MHRVIRAAAVTAATAVLALGAAPAFASHGGGGGGGGGATTPAPGSVDLSGTWTGVESTFLGDDRVVLTLSVNGGSYSGTYTDLSLGESTYKLAALTISGQDVTMGFTRGGKPGQSRAVALQATLSEDGRTLTGTFSTAPLTLSR